MCYRFPSCICTSLLGLYHKIIPQKKQDCQYLSPQILPIIYKLMNMVTILMRKNPDYML